MDEINILKNEPDESLMRELFAMFGLAYYQSECLHRGLCLLYAYLELPPSGLTTGPIVEERLSKAAALTLGEVITKLQPNLPAEFSNELQVAVAKRNFLAHHFWFERSHLMLNSDDVHNLIGELKTWAELFSDLDHRIEELSEPKFLEYGMTEEKLQDCLARIVAGETESQLLGRQELREMEKKLAKKQQLIRVWELKSENDSTGKPLVFELADHSLWQLSDIGLGRTKFQKIEGDWIENVLVKEHLPAFIEPRPSVIVPWEYELTLARNTVFWVKPGRQPKTFVWGIRVPSK